MRTTMARETRRVPMAPPLRARSRRTGVVIADEARRIRAMGRCSRKTFLSGFRSKTARSTFRRWQKTR